MAEKGHREMRHLLPGNETPNYRETKHVLPGNETPFDPDLPGNETPFSGLTSRNDKTNHAVNFVYKLYNYNNTVVDVLE